MNIQPIEKITIHNDIANNIKTKLPTIIIGSLTLVASLAWNEAFKAMIDQYIPENYKNKQNAWSKVLYAFVITCIIIIAITFILKLS